MRRFARRATAAAAGLAALQGCAGAARTGHVATGVQASLPAPLVAAGELEGRALLGELPGRAERLGAGSPVVVASAEALDNGWVGGFVDVPRDDCLLSYARGSSSIDDVDVAIYSEDGATLAVDEGRDVHPTVLMCAPHPDRVYVAAHVVEGEGLVAVGAQLVRKERAVIVARALGARGVVGQGPRPADGWPDLDDIVRVHHAQLGGEWEEIRRAALAVDARMPTVVALPIEAGECVDAIAVPDDDVAFLDLEAFDDQGRSVGRSKDGDGTRTLTVCSPVHVAGTLAVRPHVGRGLAAIVLARGGGGREHGVPASADVVWAASSHPLEQAREARDALLARSGYAAPTTTSAGTLAIGRRVSLPLDLASAPGSCRRVEVVAGAPLALIDASIWSDAGALVASASASGSLALFACARGTARLDLETRGRAGPFAIAVRVEPWKAAALSAFPLAASRMLARAASGPEMIFRGKSMAVRELRLDDEHVTSWTEDIPAGGCVRTTIGAQGDGAGVEVRAFDAADGEIDRSEDAHAASVQACAGPDAPRSVRFEARASAGRVDAVLGERVDPPG